MSDILLREVYPISAGAYETAGEASASIKRKLKQLGIDSGVLRRISVASYEVELNLVIHSMGGTLTLAVDPEQIMLISKDVGPGIPDITRAMTEGYSTANEEEIKSFYSGYIAHLLEVGNFYTAQTRAAVQGILDPQAADDGAVENVIIQSILQSGFSRIMAEKLLHLQNADPERVMELEKVSDSRGRHPLVQIPEKED